MEKNMTNWQELLDYLRFLWDENKFSIFYLGWLLQTWYMLGLILK